MNAKPGSARTYEIPELKRGGVVITTINSGAGDFVRYVLLKDPETPGEPNVQIETGDLTHDQAGRWFIDRVVPMELGKYRVVFRVQLDGAPDEWETAYRVVPSPIP